MIDFQHTKTFAIMHRDTKTAGRFFATNDDEDERIELVL